MSKELELLSASKLREELKAYDSSTFSESFLDLDTSKALKPRKTIDPNAKENVVEIKNLHVYFKSHGKDNHVIRGIDLNIKRGETFAIVGESGSGKSVFTKTLTGMNDSNSKIKKGSIKLNNLTIEDPRVVKHKFKIEDVRKNTLIKMKDNSFETIKEKELAKFDKETASLLKPLEAKFNQNSVEHQIGLFDEKQNKTKENKLTYFDLYYTDKVAQLLSKRARISLRNQNSISAFSRRMGKVFLGTFPNINYDEYLSFLASLDSEYQGQLDSLYSQLDELVHTFDVENPNVNLNEANAKFKELKASFNTLTNEKINKAIVRKNEAFSGETVELTYAQKASIYSNIVDYKSEYVNFENNYITALYDYKIDLLNNKKEKDINDYQALLNLQREEQLKSLNEKFSKESAENLTNEINSLKSSREKERFNLSIKLLKDIDSQAAVNAPLLATDIFSAEERDFFRTFTSIDLNTIIDFKLKILKEIAIRSNFIADTPKLRTEALQHLDNLDEDKLSTLTNLLGVDCKLDYKDYTSAIKQLEQLKSNFEKDSAELSSDSQHDQEFIKVKQSLLETEFKSKENKLLRDIDFLKNKIVDSITNSSVHDTQKVQFCDHRIFELKNLSKQTSDSNYYSSITKNLVRERILNKEYVDLAKLKSNKEWSMIRGSRIATIFQDPMTSLNPLLSIGEQISEVLRIHHNLSREEAKKEALSLLEKVKIPQPEKRYKEYPFQYSGGMRQRVVIAVALACRPDILICDEPTTALDVTVQAQILKLIKDLQEEYGFTIIFITHDLGVVAGVADRIGVMYGGQIVEYGTDKDIFYHAAHPYTWALLSSLPQLAVSDEPLTYIKGNPPSFGKEIEGDAFAPRSNYAMRIDFIKEAPMTKVSETHYAKTWLLDPRAPKVQKPAVIRNLEERMQQTAKEFMAEQEQLIKQTVSNEEGQ